MIAYEILKFNFKNSDSLICQNILQPLVFGLKKLQPRIPSDEQIQVAIMSMANCIKHSEDTAQFDELLSTSKEV